jgi:hypothetical protein
VNIDNDRNLVVRRDLGLRVEVQVVGHRKWLSEWFVIDWAFKSRPIFLQISLQCAVYALYKR